MTSAAADPENIEYQAWDRAELRPVLRYFENPLPGHPTPITSATILTTDQGKMTTSAPVSG